MNIILVLASGVISALIGAMIGLGIGNIALRQNTSQIRSHYSAYYENLYGRNFIWIGSGAGLVIGMGQECLRQMKQQQEDEQKQDDERYNE